MLSISETARKNLSEVKIRYSAASDYKNLVTALDALAARHASVRLFSIGVSAEGRSIPAVALGKEIDKTDEPSAAVYVGGFHGCDIVSPAVFLRFISDYAEYLDEGKRVYGISMPYIYEKFALTVVPMLNPDGYVIRREGAQNSLISDRLSLKNSADGYPSGDFSHWKYNAVGHDVERSFYDGSGVTESEALMRYLALSEDKLSLVLTLSDSSGIRYSSGGVIPARGRNVARLISRMSGYVMNSPSEDAECSTPVDYAIRSMNSSAYGIGYLDEGEGVPSDPEDYVRTYAAMRECLFSCVLL